MATYTCPTASQADFGTTFAMVVAGDTIIIPAQPATWGTGGTRTFINLAIRVICLATITNADDASTSGTINLVAAVQWEGSMTAIGSAISANTIFATGADGWKISGVTADVGAGGGYFAKVQGNGLITGNDITLDSGTTEAIFISGPSTAWDSNPALGSLNQVYIERNTFRGTGYICDANSYAQAVVRFNTIPGTIKVDGHGLASNTPNYGVRSMEVLFNHWTNTVVGPHWPAIEMRGGNCIVLFNTADHPDPTYALFEMRDYGYDAQWPNFGNVFQTPNNYPIGYQIGTGKNTTINATAITNHQMVRIKTVGTTDFTAIGASANTVGVQFIATGAGTGSGTVTTTPVTEPGYVIGNTQNGAAWARSNVAPAAGAITLYGSAFTENDIIQSDRNFFADSGFYGSTFTFNGSKGCGIGTAAQMNAITPIKTGVGFWVTNQGSWNRFLPPNTSGQLYRWNGLAWALYYTPAQYPHPLAEGDADHLRVVKTTNSSPVTELYKRCAPGGIPAFEVVHHSGNWPQDPPNDFDYAEVLPPPGQNISIIAKETNTLPEMLALRNTLL